MKRCFNRKACKPARAGSSQETSRAELKFQLVSLTKPSQAKPSLLRATASQAEPGSTRLVSTPTHSHQETTFLSPPHPQPPPHSPWFASFLYPVFSSRILLLVNDLLSVDFLLSVNVLLYYLLSVDFFIHQMY